MIEMLDKKIPTVLVIEDDLVLINYLDDILSTNYEVKIAVNEKEGIKLAKELQPDLIISNVTIPKINGLEICKILKKDARTSQIPIILLIEKATDKNILAVLESGADIYVAKPFNREILLAYSKTLLAGRNKVESSIMNSDIVLTSKKLEISTIDQEFLMNLMEIMEDNFSRFDFDMQQLSTLMNLSYRGLARKVKSLTNQTANEFLRNLRLKKAAVLLENGKLPINEISIAVGFNDPAYFSRCFQKQFGISPSKYGVHSNR